MDFVLLIFISLPQSRHRAKNESKFIEIKCSSLCKLTDFVNLSVITTNCIISLKPGDFNDCQGLTLLCDNDRGWCVSQYDRSHSLCCSPPPFSARVVRLDWSHPGRPSGIMLGYEILRRTLRSCAPGSTAIASFLGEASAGGLMLRCSYLQCPAAYGVCEVSCFHIDTQVIMFGYFTLFVFLSSIFFRFT